jgi:hypothetical protein
MSTANYRVVEWPWGGYVIQKYIKPIDSEKYDWYFAENEYGVLDSVTHPTYKTTEEAEKRIGEMV